MPRAAAVLLVGLVGSAFAAQPPERAFKRAVEAVQIDVRVLDGNGAFVLGLTKDDFVVDEDGREQSMTAFDLVDIPIVTGAPAAAPIVDPDVASNALGDAGRLYLIVLDDLHTHPLRSITVRELAREFIERNMGPADRAAIIATSARRELATEFTNNRGRLLAAASRFEGGFSAGALCGSDRGACLAEERATMRYLTTLAKWLSGVDERRKALLFIGEGFDGGISDVFKTPDGRSTMFDGLSNVNDAASDMREVINAAARSNVSIFAIDPRGLPGAPYSSIKPVTTLAADDEAKAVIQRQSLEILAEETGGFALVRSNAFSEAFARVVAESSSYYLLGYTSTNTRHDGTFRHVRVRAKRQGLTVRARPGYVALDDAKSKRPQPTNGIAPALLEAMQSPMQVAGLTLTMSAAPFRGAGSRASIAVVVEAPGGDLPLSLWLVAANPDGAIKAEEHGTLDEKPAAGTSPPSSAHGLRLVSRLNNVQPGRYELRVAAVDRAGASGSVQFDLDVPDFSKGRIAMSGLLLSSADGAAAPTSGTDRVWTTVLPDPPTAVRAFSAADRISLYTEIYANGGKAGEPIEVTTSIRRDSGESVFTRRDMLSKKIDGKGIVYPFSEPIPLSGIGAGGYTLTVEASSATKAADRALRQIPIAVR